MPEKIKVLITDDHLLIRQVLRKTINHQCDMNVIGEATDGVEAIKLAKQFAPDVILMDVNMPNMDGIAATKKIMAYKNHVRIIGLSLHNDISVKTSMLKAGAVAYLTKSDDMEKICETIRRHTRV